MGTTSRPGSKPLAASLVAEDLAIDDRTLTKRVFLPARPKLEQARAAVAGLTDVAEAWETLAARGVLSAEWLSDANRLFAEQETPPALQREAGTQPSYESVKEYLRAGPRLADVPTSMELVISLASDIVGIESAEQVARETVRRLAPWGCPQPSKIAWRQVDPSSWETQPGDFRHMPAAMAVGHAFRPLEARMPALIRARKYEFGSVAWRAAYSWECAMQWRVVTAQDSKISREALEKSQDSGYEPVPKSLAKRPFRELANPFEPLLSLWAAGYALDAITPEVIVLAIAPATDSGRKRPSRASRSTTL